MEFDDSLSTSMGDFGESTQDLEIPESLPMMAVRDVVVFNYMIIPLFVGRPGSIEAVNEGLSKNKLLMLVTQKDPTKDDPEEKDLYSVGMVSMIMRTLKLPDGRLKVLVQAISKARVRSFQQQKPFYRVEIDLIDEPEAGEITVETEALMRTVREQTEKIMSLRGLLSSDLMMIINNIEEPGRLADLVGSNLRLKIAESQKILETIDPTERLRLVADLLHKELEVSTVQAKIQSDAKEEMSRSQREYFLREQIQALKRELGDEDGYSQEIEDLRKQLRRKKMPKYAKKEAKKQLKRLEMMHPDASEATIVRTYLDWFIDLPWKESSTDLLDLKVAARGRIQVGQFADMIVPNKDYFQVPEDDISFLTSDMTVVGGRVVFGSGSFQQHDDNPVPPAMPDWSPVRRYGGYAAWGEPDGAGKNSLTAARYQSLCGCANSCGMHGHSHAKAWGSSVPVSDPKGFFGALGCSCWM